VAAYLEMKNKKIKIEAGHENLNQQHNTKLPKGRKVVDKANAQSFCSIVAREKKRKTLRSHWGN